jgi:tRNA threonylcarbamoyladenosine biosynthesis protein TsaE
VRLADAAATRRFGAALASQLGAGDTVLLSGSLGAGKTTLARGILAGLGYVGEVPSPTFTLVQAYEPPAVRLPVWHMDLYRLNRPEEALQLGWEEALETGACLIEWPDRLGLAAPADALHLMLSVQPDGHALEWHGPSSWLERIAKLGQEQR